MSIRYSTGHDGVAVVSPFGDMVSSTVLMACAIAPWSPASLRLYRCGLTRHAALTAFRNTPAVPSVESVSHGSVPFPAGSGAHLPSLLLEYWHTA